MFAHMCPAEVQEAPGGSNPDLGTRLQLTVLLIRQGPLDPVVLDPIRQVRSGKNGQGPV